MYRLREGMLEVLLAHPGGPLFARKDEGHWTIPKGEYDPGEDALTAARREFQEETGLPAPAAATAFIDLGAIRQTGGKVVQAWAFRGDCDPATIVSNTFEMEWPPRSGRMQTFPEVDRCAFLGLEHASRKIKPAQVPFLDRLRSALAIH
jgi:predicted NUDIX family NTP pyrophosphohydrolase